jgi:hypothetical protein
MTAFDRSLLSEQVALLDRRPTDPAWSSRLVSADPVAALGETFLLNGLVTPTRVGATALVPAEAREAVADWLSGLLLTAEDELVEPPGAGGVDQPVLALDVLAAHAGLDLTALPPVHRRWRLTTEIYVLHARSVYLVSGPLALRHKALTDDELGIAYGPRLLPFLPAGEEPTGTMVFVVGVPARTAALGGLRGYRGGILHAGMAIAELAALADSGCHPGECRWLWETEFFDDACARVLGIDGVERFAAGIGVHLAPAEPAAGSAGSAEPAASAGPAGSAEPAGPAGEPA